MNKPKITLVSSMVCTRTLTDAVIDVKNEVGDTFDFQVLFINDLQHEKITKQEFLTVLESTTILMIDIRGNNSAVEVLVNYYHSMEIEDPEKFKQKTIISLVGGNTELRELTKMGSFEAKKIPSKKMQELGFDEIPDLSELVKKGIRISQNIAKIAKYLPIGMMRHMRNWTMAMDYWVYGYSGIPENHVNLIRFLLKEYLGVKIKDVPLPLKIPQNGIYHPLLNKYYSSLLDYLNEHPLDSSKQTIGIFYYGGIYFEQTLPIVKEFLLYLHDYNVLPVYSEVTSNLKTIQDFFFQDGNSLVSLVINLQYFQLNGGPFGGSNLPTLELYKKMDVPQFNPVINFDMSLDDYMQSKQGILPINQIIAVIMPELDGRIEMMNVGCMDHLGMSEEINSPVYDIVPLQDNIKIIANRVISWLRLRAKQNHQKKIALILYDYPPGEESLGNASYLDVYTSLQRIIERLISEGYDAGNDLGKFTDISELLIKGCLVNNPKHIDTHNFQGVSLDEIQYQHLQNNIPESLLNRINTVWGSFPGRIMAQNNKILLPIIQFGNIYIGIQPPRSQIIDNSNEYHNQELPPHHQYFGFYRYLTEIIGIDAMIHVGTHGTIEFLPGKENVGYWTDYNLMLLGSIPNLYIYHVSNTSESAIAKRRSNAVIINHSSPSIQISDTYEQYESLELLLQEYNAEIHKDSSEMEKVNTLISNIQSLALELNIKSSSVSEIEKTLYRLKIAAIPTGLHVIGDPFNISQKFDFVLNLMLHSPSVPSGIQSLVKEYSMDGKPNIPLLRQLISETSEHSIEGMVKGSILSISAEQQKSLTDWLRTIIPSLNVDDEINNLIHGLEGGFIPPGYGGDPIRSPEIFPTGRNSFGFDPRLIPSSIATIRGREIAQKLLQEHVTKTGVYPETVSVVLWAFETMKTGGETIGQIFEYIGVRAIKQKSVWTTELEAIPLSEMLHPRINVVITICGIFRDTFAYLVDILNQAIQLVAALNEPLECNFIRKTAFDLKDKGFLHTEARIFGPAPGKYNTNLTDIIDQGNWKIEKELVADYISNMGFVYLSHLKIENSISLFRENIGKINFTSQIRDSSEYQITDLDHYYEFSGGLQRAIEDIKGESVPIYIADTADTEIVVEPIEQIIREGAITRNLNPKWLDGMLKHKFHGTQKVAERIKNLMGLAATTHQVDNWVWEKSYSRYIEDPDYRKQLSENNKFAMMNICKSLLEANQRGYWTTESSHLDAIKRLYLELEGWVEKQQILSK